MTVHPTAGISIEYDGGFDSALDSKLKTLAEKFDGELSGSGCLLVEPYTRDLEFEIPLNRLAAFQTEAAQIITTHRSGNWN